MSFTPCRQWISAHAGAACIACEGGRKRLPDTCPCCGGTGVHAAVKEQGKSGVQHNAYAVKQIRVKEGRGRPRKVNPGESTQASA